MAKIETKSDNASIMEKLLREVDAFLKVNTDISPTAFGLMVVNDGHLYRDMKAGKDLRASTIDKVRRFMCEYRSREHAA